LTGNDAPSQLIVLENTARTRLNVQGRHAHGVLGRVQASPEMVGVCHPLSCNECVSAWVGGQFDIDLRTSLDRRRKRREVVR
jgi:hypothetical protein